MNQKFDEETNEKCDEETNENVMKKLTIET